MATQDINLGTLTLQPGRQLLADGAPVPLGRKSLDILSTLAEARGELVTKDELMAAVWPGLVVEENAIQAHVVALRKALGREASRLKTVRGFGYRLDVVGETTGQRAKEAPVATAAPVAASAQGGSPWAGATNRRAGIAAAATLLLLLIAALLWQQDRQVEARVGLVAGDGPGAAALAAALATDLTRLAGARPGNLAIAATDPGDSDYVVRVSMRGAGETPGADLTLASRRSAELLWSASIDRPSAGGDVREQAAVRLGAVLLCATGTGELDRRLDPVAMRLFLGACDRADEPADEAMLASLQALARRSPRFAPGLAHLARVEAELSRAWPFGPPEEHSNARKQALRRAAREHMLSARSLDPALGLTYLVEEDLLPSHRWQQRLAVVERGLAADPGNARLHGRYVHALQSVGRITAAMGSARRAAALDPISPASRAVLISMLAYSGRHEDARRELAVAEKLWPGSAAIEDASYRFALRYGDPETAIRLFEPYQLQSGPIDQSRARARAIMAARIDPTAANVDRALALIKQWNRGVDSETNGFYFSTLAQHGRVDEAFRLLEDPAWQVTIRDEMEVYFRDYTWPLRNDPRFMRFAARIGLLRYWQSSGRWPDFCQDARLTYDCHDEARRISASAAETAAPPT